MASRLITLAAVSFLTSAALAKDWPQWQGPNRDGKSAEGGWLKTWPTGGPKLLWTFNQAGSGYSAGAVVGSTLYSMGGEDRKDDFVFALDVLTGKQKWRTPIAPAYSNNYGDGPRGTPAIDGDCLYGLAGKGDLVCLDRNSGKLLWKKNLVSDLNGKLMSGWGYSESPLVDGDNVICSPGGEDGTLAALDKKTGSVKWRSKDVGDSASYSSVVISKAGGIKQYVQLTGASVIGVAAADGKLLWKIKGDGYKVAVIPTAVISGDYVFATADYGAKCMLIKLTRSGDGISAEKVYENREMENHHGGVILDQGHVFGSTGNANRKETLPFIALNLMTGKSAWREEKALEPSGVCWADGYIYCYGQETGTLVRVASSTSGYTEAGRFKIPRESKNRKPQGAIWTHPVVTNGKLYLRDQELLFCYDLTGGGRGAE